MKPGNAWWADDPNVVICDAKGCGCPVQRTPNGTVADGLRAHVKTVHPGFKVVEGPVEPAPAGAQS